MKFYHRFYNFIIDRPILRFLIQSKRFRVYQGKTRFMPQIYFESSIHLWTDENGVTHTKNEFGTLRALLGYIYYGITQRFPQWRDEMLAINKLYFQRGAIAFNSVQDSTRGSGTSKSFSFTNTAGDCFIGYTRNTNGSSPSSETYNSVAATLVASQDNGADHRHNMYQLVAPATGANTVAISYSVSQGFIDAAALSYSGVHQSNPCPANNTTNTATSQTTFSPSMTTTIDNSWVIACIGNSTGDSTAGANTSERFSNANGNGFYDSNAVVSPAGSRSLTITRPSNSNWTSVLAELQVAASAGGTTTPTPRLLHLGVG